MTRSERISFCFITGVIAIVLLAGLGTPFLTVLFSLLFLRIMHRSVQYKWVAILIFAVANAIVFYGFVSFIRQAISTLPRILSESLPMIGDYARAHGLNYLASDEDIQDLRAFGVETLKEQLGDVAKYATIATKEFLIMLISFVVAASLFVNGELDLDRERYAKRNNLYSAVCAAISQRFTAFFRSFSTVMGAQLLISSINTLATAIFVFTISLPHAFVVVVITFLCGLLPIIGNLMSNAIIFSISATISVKLAMAALAFLIILHKFEYFLNSKIIGSRIRNPMWLTLLALVVGEKLAGIPGMILAPVILNYIKLETSRIECDDEALYTLSA